MDIPPTVQRPEGENRSAGAAGVSRISWLGLCSWSRSWGGWPWGAGRASTPPLPWVFVIPQSLLHPFFFLGHVPISQVGKPTYTKGLTARKWQSWKGYPDKGLPSKGVGHPVSRRGQLTLLPFLMSEVAQSVQAWVGGWGAVIKDGLTAPAAGGIGQDRVLSSPSLKQVPES